MTTRWLLPLAMVLALAGLVVMPGRLPHIGGGIMLVLFAVGGVVQWLMRPVLRVDDEGYAIEQRGRDKLRVRWSEVVQVRIDRGESAVYVDCGDKARNLFVPPRRGYGFRFADAERVCARVLGAVPAERVVEVERFDVS